MPSFDRPLAPLLFLSHAGIDTEAARSLKQRLEAAPETRAHGLRIWFDQDDLRTGEPWQAQLEEAIQHRSTAFAVYIGSRSVVNWVNAEVQLALGRAVTDPAYRFIPILAPQAPGPEALPGFVALYEGVANVEGQPDQFAKLVAAVLGQDAAGTAKLEGEPFFGLKAVDEDRAHLFFGREPEAETLLQLLRREPLVMVTGDSGSGKSSLARAGLVPRWRGGGLAEAMGERAAETIWHVVQVQPRTRPFQSLAEAVSEAAKRLGLSLADRGTLERWARSGDPDQVRRALWCDLPPDRTRVLLLVDQFEELVTIAEPAERVPFVRLLCTLADPHDPRARVVLTMRRDYYNLVSAFPALYDRLEADGHRARQILSRISPDGLRRLVTEPLRLAGVPEGDRAALADQVAAEMGDRPGDLALVQMALTETWDRRHAFGDDLLRAYAGVGRIEGAIARAAEDVYQHTLDEDERARAEPVFVRLVRLGDTGGVTRRLATRAEFGDAQWRLVQKLASKEAKRLVLVGGGETADTAEIAHEALVTQWPRYQTWLSGRDPDGADRAADKRALDALIPRAVGWAAAPEARAKAKYLAIGADLDTFSGLAERRPAWLSADEHQFVMDSRAHVARQQRRERWLFRGAMAAAVVAILAAGGAWQQRNRAVVETHRAEAQRALAERQTTLAEQRATALTVALAEARANLIWSRLEFRTDDLQPYEVGALWDLVTEAPATRAAFLKQLTENPPLVLRFVQHPEPVLRAFGLRFPAEQAQAVLGAVLDTIRDTTSPDAQRSLAQAVEVLAPKLTAAQAQAMLDRVLDAIRDTTNAPHALWPLVWAGQALPVQLTAAQVQTMLDPILDTIRATTDPESIKRLPLTYRLTYKVEHPLQVVQNLASKLTTEQVQAALDAVLDAMRDTTSPNAQQSLAQAVEALAPQLTAEQAQAALGPVLDAIRAIRRDRDSASNYGLPPLLQAVEALAPQLTAEQAQAALGPVLDAMRGLTGDFSSIEKKVLVQAVKALALKFTAEQVQAALDAVLDAMRDTTDPRALWPQTQAVEALAPQLTAEQAQAALGPVLNVIRAMRGDARSYELLPLARALEQAVEALAPQLTAEQAQAALGPILDTMRDTTSPNAQQSLAQAVEALAPQLTAEQAQAALGPVLDSIRTLKVTLGESPDAQEGLAGAIETLTSKLTREQAQVALGPVLDAMKTTPNLRPKLALTRAGQAVLTTERRLHLLRLSFDFMREHGFTRRELVWTVQALASELTGEQAQAVLGHALEVMRGTTTPDDLQLQAQAIQALPVQLTREQAQAALGPILEAMRQSSANSSTQAELAGAVEALAPKLVIEAKRDMQRLARSGLGATGNGAVAIAWARALEALLPPAPASDYAGALVEVLKYPTTTLRKKYGDGNEPASATEYLLGKLHERFPDTRALQRDNLQDTLAWIAKSYPEIDLTSPPVRPASLDEIVVSLPVPR